MLMDTKTVEQVVEDLRNNPIDPASVPVVPAVPATAIKEPFVCENGHVLGIVTRKHRSGGGVIKVLILFRRAFMITETVPQNFLFAEIKLGTISCSICGKEREWNSFNKKKKAGSYVAE